MLHYQRTWRAIGILILALIVIGSLTPVPSTNIKIQAYDKVAHVLMYLLLMAWFSQVYTNNNRILVAGLCFAVGLGLELLQGMVPYRTFDLHDVIANTAGIIVGWLLMVSPLQYSLLLVDRWFVRQFSREG